MFFKDVRGIFALRSQNLKKQALGTLEGLVKLVKQKNKPMLQNQQKKLYRIDSNTNFTRIVLEIAHHKC
jgi:hypothetical protein